jgi:hyperosmotically inducible protein
MKMKRNFKVRLIVCMVCVWGAAASAQTTSSQQASDAAMSTQHRYAHPSAADKALARQVRRQLVRTKGVDASEVAVGVRDGAVLLRGRLNDAGQIARVEAAVKTVPGVKSVDNQLTLQPSD